MQYLVSTITDSEFPIDECREMFEPSRLKREFGLAPGEFQSPIYESAGFLAPDGEFMESGDYTKETRFRIYGKIFDCETEASAALEKRFLEMVDEFGIKFPGDIPAARECFNNWTDQECKEDLICDDSYDQLSLSDETETILTRR